MEKTAPQGGTDGLVLGTKANKKNEKTTDDKNDKNNSNKESNGGGDINGRAKNCTFRSAKLG